MATSIAIDSILGNDLIGFVLSNASVVSIPISIFSGEPAISTRIEELVLIHDEEHPGTPLILGVMRWIQRLEPYLRPRVKVGVEEFPDAIDRIEKLAYTNVYVVPLAEIVVRDNQVVDISGSVTYVPFPGSKVYRVRCGSLLTKLLASTLTDVQSPVVVGVHKYATDVEIPLDPRYIQYHIGIFGTTGMGKSRLAKVLVDEIIQKTEYSVMIFDHTGMDYTGFYPDTTIISLEIDLDPFAMADFFMKRLRLSEYYSTYMECFCMKLKEQIPEYRKELASAIDRRSKLNEIYSRIVTLLRKVVSSLGARPETIENLTMRMSYFIKPEDLEMMLLSRSRPAEEIFNLAFKAKEQGKPLVIDLSFEETLEMKRAIIGGIIDYGWRWIYKENFQSKERKYAPINTVIVIDEVQNYAWRGGYCEEQIEKIAREGRKWKYGLIILSQRLAGSVDPNIRANLNTVFFSRLSQTTDLKEIQEFADITGIDLSNLAQLMPREFYVAGSMNPFKKPVVIRVREVK